MLPTGAIADLRAHGLVFSPALKAHHLRPYTNAHLHLGRDPPPPHLLKGDDATHLTNERPETSDVHYRCHPTKSLVWVTAFEAQAFLAVRCYHARGGTESTIERHLSTPGFDMASGRGVWVARLGGRAV